MKSEQLIEGVENLIQIIRCASATRAIFKEKLEDSEDPSLGWLTRKAIDFKFYASLAFMISKLVPIVGKKTVGKCGQFQELCETALEEHGDNPTSLMMYFTNQNHALQPLFVEFVILLKALTRSPNKMLAALFSKTFKLIPLSLAAQSISDSNLSLRVTDTWAALGDNSNFLTYEQLREYTTSNSMTAALESARSIIAEGCEEEASSEDTELMKGLILAKVNEADQPTLFTAKYANTPQQFQSSMATALRTQINFASTSGISACLLESHSFSKGKFNTWITMDNLRLISGLCCEPKADKTAACTNAYLILKISKKSSLEIFYAQVLEEASIGDFTSQYSREGELTLTFINHEQQDAQLSFILSITPTLSKEVLQTKEANMICARFEYQKKLEINAKTLQRDGLCKSPVKKRKHAALIQEAAERGVTLFISPLTPSDRYISLSPNKQPTTAGKKINRTLSVDRKAAAGEDPSECVQQRVRRQQPRQAQTFAAQPQAPAQGKRPLRKDHLGQAPVFRKAPLRHRQARATACLQPTQKYQPTAPAIGPVGSRSKQSPQRKTPPTNRIAQPVSSQPVTGEGDRQGGRFEIEPQETDHTRTIDPKKANLRAGVGISIPGVIAVASTTAAAIVAVKTAAATALMIGAIAGGVLWPILVAIAAVAAIVALGFAITRCCEQKNIDHEYTDVQTAP